MFVNPIPAPDRVVLDANTPTSTNTTIQTCTLPASSSPLSLPIEMRWDLEPDQQRSVWDMHERSFPAKYDVSFYTDLFAAKEECSFVSLCVYTTPSAYIAASRAHRRALNDAIATDVTEAAEDEILSKLTRQEQIEYSRPPMPPLVGHTMEEQEADAKRKCDISELLLQLEYIATRRAQKQAKGKKATVKSVDTAADESGAEPYSVLIGFAIGSFAYAIQRPPPSHTEGTPSSSAPQMSGAPVILTNPTGYLGSFAVDEYVRCHGVGSVLLQRYLTYMTTQIPIRASFFLHYTKESMLALLRRTRPELFTVERDLDALKAKLQAERDRQELDIIAQECGMSSGKPGEAPPPAVPKLGQLAFQLCPPLFSLYEDRRARRVLREKYQLSDEQITEARLFAKNGINWMQNQSFAERARREMAELEPELDPVLQHGVGEVWLHCNAADPSVAAYYLKRGFVLHRVIRNFYDLNGVMTDGNLLLFDSHNSENMKNSQGSVSSEENTTSPSGVTLTDMAEAQRVRRSQRAAQASTPSTDSAHGNDTDTIAHKKDDDTARPDDDAPLENADPAQAASSPTKAAPSALSRSNHYMRWLLPSEYSRVVNVDIRSTKTCRELYCRQGAALRQHTEVPKSRLMEIMETMKEVALVVNALALLTYVCFMAYRFTQTGRLW